MSPAQRLKELDQLKQMLVVQGDLQRQLLEWEVRRLTQHVESGMRVAQNTLSIGRPWLIGAGLVGGFLAIRNWRTLLGWAPHALSVWKFMRPWLRHLGY